MRDAKREEDALAEAEAEAEVAAGARREELGLPADATDEECDAVEEAAAAKALAEEGVNPRVRREELGLPAEATDDECVVAESAAAAQALAEAEAEAAAAAAARREQLDLPADATDEECAAVEAARASPSELQIAFVEAKAYQAGMEAQAKQALVSMQAELDELERQREEREEQEEQLLAGGDEWVDPITDGRNLDVETASAKERDSVMRVITVAEFEPLQLGDLGFGAGELLIVTDSSGPWWMGYRDGQPDQNGSFPSNYARPEKAGSRAAEGRLGEGWKNTMMIELPSAAP